MSQTPDCYIAWHPKKGFFFGCCARTEQICAHIMKAHGYLVGYKPTPVKITYMVEALGVNNAGEETKQTRAIEIIEEPRPGRFFKTKTSKKPARNRKDATARKPQKQMVTKANKGKGRVADKSRGVRGRKL
jgi:hypothetical protein